MERLWSQLAPRKQASEIASVVADTNSAPADLVLDPGRHATSSGYVTGYPSQCHRCRPSSTSSGPSSSANLSNTSRGSDTPLTSTCSYDSTTTTGTSSRGTRRAASSRWLPVWARSFENPSLRIASSGRPDQPLSAMLLTSSSTSAERSGACGGSMSSGEYHEIKSSQGPGCPGIGPTLRTLGERFVI